MDIISHGLWGGIALGRKKKKLFFLVFLISIIPDAISFGILMLAEILGLANHPDWSKGHPDMGQIPNFVDFLYNISHSFFIFGLVFLIIFIIYKKPFWPLLAWGLHILIDIPSHSFDFFPTPFLWPLSDFKINGIGWGEPVIFLSNLSFLMLIYLAWGINYWKNKKIKVFK